MHLLQQAALLAGLGASGFYIYTELEKAKAKAAETEEERPPTPTTDDTGQTNITEVGTDIFQQIDRTFAYTLLLKAHSDVTDFDSLTDSDLAQLLQAINIDPDVLRTHMTQEQADFLIHSAEEAARLRVEITIDQATKEQWNTMIKAQKKQEVEAWAVDQNSNINLQFLNDPYQPFYDFIGSVDLATGHTLLGGLTTRDTIMSRRGTYSVDPYIRAFILTLPATGDIMVMGLAFGWDDLIENTLKPLNGQRKQEAIDLLAVKVTSKKAIIDSTDYVALGWRVDDDGNIIEPPEV